MKNFKSLLIIFCVAVSRGTQLQLNSELDHHLNTMVELWRAGSIHTCSPVPLPSMNSIPVPDYEGSIDQKGIVIKYRTGQMRLTGMEHSIVNNITTSTLGHNLAASVNFTIPELKLISDNYWIKGTAYYIIPIEGSGKLEITLYDVNIKFDIWLQPLGNGTAIKDAKFKYTVGSVKADLQNSSWPINSVLTNEGVNILSLSHDEITTAVQNALKLNAAEVLQNIPPAVLMKHTANAALCSNLDKNNVKITVNINPNPTVTETTAKSFALPDMNAIVNAIKDIGDKLPRDVDIKENIVDPIVNTVNDIKEVDIQENIVDPIVNTVNEIWDGILNLGR